MASPKPFDFEDRRRKNPAQASFVVEKRLTSAQNELTVVQANQMVVESEQEAEPIELAVVSPSLRFVRSNFIAAEKGLQMPRSN